MRIARGVVLQGKCVDPLTSCPATEKACPEKEGNRSSLHTATHSSGHHGTATGGPDATASASQSATSGKGSNAAVDVNVEYHGLSAALLLAALVAL